MSDPLRALRGLVDGGRGWSAERCATALLDRQTADFDVAVPGAGEGRRARAGPAPRRVMRSSSPRRSARGGWSPTTDAWQLDLLPLDGATIEDDLGRRDLTVNAIAAPLGRERLRRPVRRRSTICGRRRLRVVSAEAFQRDPLRTLRLARLACELDFDVERGDAARGSRGGARAAASRSRARCSPSSNGWSAPTRALDGLELMEEIGATDAVLPELSALRGVEQSRFHHLDVSRPHARGARARRSRWSATRSRCAPDLQTPGGAARSLDAPLANELTRGQALRFGALLHDIAKPQTRAVTPEGRSRSWVTTSPAPSMSVDDPRAAAGQRAAARARGGADPPSPAARVPRPRDAAQPPRRL